MGLDGLNTLGKAAQLIPSDVPLFGHGRQNALLMGKADINADAKSAHLRRQTEKHSEKAPKKTVGEIPRKRNA